MLNTINPKKYRADIDGLRAIAVIAVILYHFKIPFFDGGFVGVDIFFVISGYLITKNIVSLIDSGKFSFSDFYFRRVRRLIPALLVVVLSTFVASLFFLSPNDMSSFAGSVVYALIGFSNIFFWMQSGYFDSFASLKPILHTWSLGVELQFYILWPLLLWIVCKNWPNHSKRVLFVSAFIAIFTALSVYYSYKDSTAAFFLTPFRMHEFAIGALISFKKDITPKKTSLTIYSIGLALVLYSIFSFRVGEIVFPGYMALIPCIGSAMMIFADTKTLPSLVTNNKISAHIGEISYSLYLVHWPVFVIGSYAFVFPPTPLQTASLIITTVVLSYCLYFGVEKRFRSPVNAKLSGPSFSLSCTAFGMVVTVFAASCWGDGGWEWRLPAEIRKVNNIDESLTKGYTWLVQQKLDAKQGFDKNDKREKLLIIGDSQSADIVNALNEAGTLERYDVVARTVGNVCGTPYVNPQEIDDYLNAKNGMTASKPNLATICKEQMKRLMDGDLLNESNKIIISMYYPQNLTKYVDDGISEIKSKTNAIVYVVGRKNLSKSSIAIINSFHRIVGIDKFAAKFIEPTTTMANDNVKQIKGTKFVDMMSLVCPEKDSCLVVDKKNRPLLYDDAHFTKYGAEFFGPQIANLIN